MTQVELNQIGASQSIEIANVKLAMQQQAQSMNGFLQMAADNKKALEAAAQPHLGRRIDISV